MLACLQTIQLKWELCFLCRRRVRCKSLMRFLTFLAMLLNFQKFVCAHAQTLSCEVKRDTSESCNSLRHQVVAWYACFGRLLVLLCVRQLLGNAWETAKRRAGKIHLTVKIFEHTQFSSALRWACVWWKLRRAHKFLQLKIERRWSWLGGERISTRYFISSPSHTSHKFGCLSLIDEIAVCVRQNIFQLGNWIFSK